MSKIGVITSSLRTSRLNDKVSQYVLDLVESTPGVSFHHIDLLKYDLPLYDDPVFPAALPSENPTPNYSKEAVRNWSSEISKYNGYIFVTPEYNRCIPASLKNGLDHLFYEWLGKPVGIVSYGGAGGSSATQVLTTIVKDSFKMKLVETSPSLHVDRESIKKVELHDKDFEHWEETAKEEIISMVEELKKELAK